MSNDGWGKKRWLALAFVGLFVVLLTGMRVWWTSAFHNAGQAAVVQGQLDLREWDPIAERPISLDGQWEFYPSTWLIEDGSRKEPIAGQPSLLHVPGGWNDALNPEHSGSYGYGSYRLRILVDPSRDVTYSIRLSSVRSSSALYVDGRLLSRMGEPGSDAQPYSSANVPYSASFASNGSGVIEVIVQAANFDDPRGGGIVRSVKFGTEAAVAREAALSVAMQQIVAVVFFLHACYALILFAVGMRDTRLLAFALVTVSAMFIHLIGSEEKLLPSWFLIPYDWGFKLVHLGLVGVAFALPPCISEQLPVLWRRLWPWYAAFCGVFVCATLFLPVATIVQLQPLYYACFLASIVVTLATLLRLSLRHVQSHVLLLLSLVAFVNSLLWMGIYVLTGIKIVYYPFDLIISMTCFASVWFNRYNQVHNETKQLAAKLQMADKVKDEFLANTSHELRNPLNGILNMSQAVLERERHLLNDRSIKEMETVLSVGRRMTWMLNDLLDVMSLKESRLRLQFRAFSMQTILSGVLDMLRSLTEGKPVRLVNRIPDSFPPVFADENRVIQIVFNLFHNAVKYTAEGEIAIRGEVRDGRAHIVISDTGIGMDEETLRRIFEPYEQGDAGKMMFEGGFGLGLSISRQLAELHGGTLQASSVPGQGSEFMFSLPLSDPASSLDASWREPETVAVQSPGLQWIGLDGTEVAVASTAAALSDSAESVKSVKSIKSVESPESASNGQLRLAVDLPRILIVDDDPVNLHVLETMLSRDRYELFTVTSGKQALDALEEKEWDLVISDVMMPHMSGYELTRTIRRRFTITELPVLLVTARSQPKDIENGFLSGANDYVIKPVDVLEVRARVKALTEVRQSVRERLNMEAAWLQSQIQPHFLFNTLNAVSALSDIDTERMRKLLDVFGQFLRDKFKYQHFDELAPIKDELGIVRSYLYIEQERFDDRLRVQWDVEECDELKLPLLTIQPLVENAVRHGIMQRMDGGTVWIRVFNRETHAEIVVEDDGVGMDEELLEQRQEADAGTGVGLRNTDLRLRRRYGKGLQIRSEPGRGTVISFIVPM